MSNVYCDVTAVIVTFNSVKVVGDLLDSLPSAFGPITPAIIVVDNGSGDGTAELVIARGDCTVIRSDNVGFAAGVNKGAAAAGPASAILVLNPDATLAPNSIPAMIDAMGTNPRVGIVAPRIVDIDGRLFCSLRREPTLRRASGLGFTRLPGLSEYVTEPEVYSRQHIVDWALGAVLLISRDCFRELCGFDESYFLYSEETDFCLRARDRGWFTLYTPSAEAMHLGGGSGQNDRTHSMQIVNRVRLYRRRHDSVRAALYLGLTVLSELTWVIRGQRSARASVRALLRPSTRPPELNCGPGLLPD